MEDSRIVDLYLERNEESIKLTKEKYGKKILSVSFGVTQDLEISEECENDTYLECWNRIPPNEPRTYFLPFLLRIARNISLNRVIANERLKRKADIDELSSELTECIPDPKTNVEDMVLGNSLSELLNSYLSTLPKEKRIVFTERYFFTLSVKEIAEKNGYSESKVKTMLLRIRNDLKEYLLKEGYRI